MQKILSKIGAGFIGAVMVGSTLLAPAMAADLSEYPAPFITDGTTDMLMVVGADASPADVVGAINVAVRLGAEPREEVTVSSDSTTVEGGEDKELTLEKSIATQFDILKDNHVAGLQDTKVRWNSKDVDIEETLDVDGLDIITSDSDTDLGSTVYLGTTGTPANFIYKYIVSDNDFDYTLVNNTGSKKMDINFLGKSLEIIDTTNATTDEITFMFGTDIVLGMGESATVDGNTVTVNSIGTGSVSVTMGTETKIISSGGEYDFGDVTVKVNSILYTDDADSRQADMSIGSDIEKTVKDGDSMELFGEPEDENDAEWVWSVDLDNSATTKMTLGAKYNQKLRDHKDDLKVKGEYFTLPNDYAKVSISKVNTAEYAIIDGEFDDYIDLDQIEDETTTTDYTSLNGFVLTSDQSETGFRVNVTGTGLVETDKVYLLKDNAGTGVVCAFDNSDNKQQIFYEGNSSVAVTDQLEIYYQDTTLPINFVCNTSLSLNLTVVEGVEGDTNVRYDVNLVSNKLGANQGQADPAELTVGGINRGTVEEDYRTQYGLILGDPDSNGDSDKIEIQVPSEQVKITVLVEGSGTTTTTTTGATVKSVIPITDNIARLDTDAEVESAKGNKNMIIIGGPAVNRLTAAVLSLDYPTYGVDSTVPENAAMIKVVENAFGGGKVAYVVAGWEAPNTQAACSVLQQYDDYSALTGTGVEVTGTATPFEVTALE